MQLYFNQSIELLFVLNTGAWRMLF